jgi:hypothetical protein
LRSFLLALPLLILFARTSDRPTESPHRTGPAGLEGWTLNDTIPDHGEERFAFQLVVARKGHVVRRVGGHSLIWNWMFLPDGRRLAYEDGPLHFAMNCVLLDISSGKKIADYDCYHDPLGEAAPAWAKQLEKFSDRPQGHID